MSANTFPAFIDPLKGAEQGFAWTGDVPLSRFSRIAQEAVESVEHQSVQVECKLSMDSYHRFLWLDATMRTQVALQCQRCLQAVKLPAETEVRIAILNDDSQVDDLAEDADFIVLGENENSQRADFRQPAKLNLLEVLEDELILCMPISAKHEQCEIEHHRVQLDEVEQKRNNPFEVLANLKGKLGS